MSTMHTSRMHLRRLCNCGDINPPQAANMYQNDHFRELLNGNNQHGQIVIFYAVIMKFITDVLLKLSRGNAAEQGLPPISMLLHLRKQPFRQCTRGKDNDIAGKYFAELRFALSPGSL